MSYSRETVTYDGASTVHIYLLRDASTDRVSGNRQVALGKIVTTIESVSIYDLGLEDSRLGTYHVHLSSFYLFINEPTVYFCDSQIKSIHILMNMM